MRTIFVILLIFLINPIWANSQILDIEKVTFNSNEGQSNLYLQQEKCSYCISNDFKKDYLVLEQIRPKETSDEYDSRLYIFLGIYYLDLSLDRKECYCIVDSSNTSGYTFQCNNYFELNNKILKFITESHFPNPIVGNMYLVRDDKIEIFRPTSDQGILFYNMIRKFYLSKLEK